MIGGVWVESKGEVKIITKSPVCIRTNLFLNIYHQSISQSIKKRIYISHVCKVVFLAFNCNAQMKILILIIAQYKSINYYYYYC